jgi:hypothetical protein
MFTGLKPLFGIEVLIFYQIDKIHKCHKRCKCCRLQCLLLAKLRLKWPYTVSNVGEKLVTSRWQHTKVLKLDLHVNDLAADVSMCAINVLIHN